MLESLCGADFLRAQGGLGFASAFELLDRARTDEDALARRLLKVRNQETESDLEKARMKVDLDSPGPQPPPQSLCSSVRVATH